jgi:peptidylprolyl isomerase
VRKLTIALLIVLCAAFAVVGCGDDEDSGTTAETTAAATSESADSGESGEAASGEKTKPDTTVPKDAPSPKGKLAFQDAEEGSGKTAKEGDEVTVHYVGVNFKDGKEFDASWDRGEPFTFTLGSGMVIPGWEQGVEGMKVGGRRELIIPPNLGYGKEGTESIPPNETLYFVVDLLEVK